ncbi:MAG: DUF4910 domain-containing protein, partial [Flavobacteriales bacterium]|nr:DUF4910 domain-containing protein [Flavobacteriales bacterium]
MKAELEKYFDRLWPICRSITGNGLRESFRILNELIPMQLTEVATGTRVLDWNVPKEWNITDAWIETPDGKKIAQFSENNLHVVNYSVAVDSKVDYETLKQHVHTHPPLPDAIPYVTSYYKERWGFCMSQNEWDQLPTEGLYRVYIDSSLKDGSLTYGQCVLPGASNEEILFSTYLCHPSMANNELSGPLALAMLYRHIAAMPHRRYTYRFVVAPETIGIIALLAAEGEHLKKHVKAGYVLTCCGDPGAFTYKMSKHKTSLADRAAAHVLKYHHPDARIIPFAVGGSDERQYCSPGYNLPVGSLMRTPYQQYPEYHTSLDNKHFISFGALEETVNTYTDIVRLIEHNQYLRCTVQYGEPNMGSRGLYPTSAEPSSARDALHRMMHLLS